MSGRRRWTALALVTAAAACSDIAHPTRDEVYEWRYITLNATGTGLDSLSFHWPAARLPVKVWAEGAAGLPDNLPKAIAAWRGAFLYGEFDATVVSDSARADVIFRAGPPPGPPSLGRVRLHAALAPQCSGATDIALSDDHTQLVLPIRSYIDPGSAADDPGLPACLALTTTHELGHALGIFQHSDEPSDLMYASPTVPGPSERDLETAEHIYHVPANLEAVSGEP
jgi:predicted Zn-dependent protease